MRRTLAAGIALAAAALMLGCEPTTSPLDLAGVYMLQTVNGDSLPYLLPPSGTTSAEVLGDRFTLSPDGTFAEVGQKLFDTAGVVTLTFPIDAGNFTRRGDTITLLSLLYGATTGTVEGSTLTLTQQGLTLVYQR